MSESGLVSRSASERNAQSHRRNAPLFLIIGCLNVVISLLAFAALTSFSWSPLRGSETLAYIIVTVLVSLQAAVLWDRVVWRTKSQRRIVALSLVILWSFGAITGFIVEVLVVQTGWNSLVLAVLLTPPATAANYLVQARLRRQAERRSGRAA